MKESKPFDCNEKYDVEKILKNLDKNELKEKIFEDDVFYRVFKRKAASNIFYKVAISGLIFCSGWLFALGMPNKKDKDFLVAKNKTEAEDFNLIDFDDEMRKVKKSNKLKDKNKITRKRRNIKKSYVKNISKAKERAKKKLKELERLIERVKRKLKLKKDRNKEAANKEQKASKQEKNGVKNSAKNTMKSECLNKNKNKEKQYKTKNKSLKSPVLLLKTNVVNEGEQKLKRKENMANKKQNTNKKENLEKYFEHINRKNKQQIKDIFRDNKKENANKHEKNDYYGAATNLTNLKYKDFEFNQKMKKEKLKIKQEKEKLKLREKQLKEKEKLIVKEKKDVNKLEKNLAKDVEKFKKEFYKTVGIKSKRILKNKRMPRRRKRFLMEKLIRAKAKNFFKPYYKNKNKRKKETEYLVDDFEILESLNDFESVTNENNNFNKEQECSNIKNFENFEKELEENVENECETKQDIEDAAKLCDVIEDNLIDSNILNLYDNTYYLVENEEKEEEEEEEEVKPEETKEEEVKPEETKEEEVKPEEKKEEIKPEETKEEEVKPEEKKEEEVNLEEKIQLLEIKEKIFLNEVEKGLVEIQVDSLRGHLNSDQEKKEDTNKEDANKENTNKEIKLDPKLLEFINSLKGECVDDEEVGDKQYISINLKKGVENVSFSNLPRIMASLSKKFSVKEIITFLRKCSMPDLSTAKTCDTNEHLNAVEGGLYAGDSFSVR